MIQSIADTVVLDEDFTREQIQEWRRQVIEQRDTLFNRNWKNRRQIVPLRSRAQEESFQFAVEWYEEFGDVVGRVKQRQRMDKLIALGYDVNAPADELPAV